MANHDRILQYLAAKPQREAAKIRRSLLQIRGLKYLDAGTVLELVEEILEAGDRERQARRARAAYDGRRRTLVGARVPRELRDRCAEAAGREGVSLYAWVTAALERALERGEEA